MPNSGFGALPVELLYRIIDYVDVETVFLSLRSVCRRFYAIINNQHRYQLDLRYISKSNFDLVCRLIRPENVISLILSDANETVGQIGLFLNRFDLHTFTRLSSLTLIQVTNSKLRRFLDAIIPCPINSFSIESQDESSSNISIVTLLSSTIEKLNHLRKFELKTKHDTPTKDIQWPVLCLIEDLTIDCCTSHQLFTILRDLSHLQTLVISKSNLRLPENLTPYSSNVKSSLKSSSLEESLIHFETIQFFLSLTPSLVYLKLTGCLSSDELFVLPFRENNFLLAYEDVVDEAIQPNVVLPVHDVSVAKTKNQFIFKRIPRRLRPT